MSIEEADMIGTLAWQRLKGILLDALQKHTDLQEATKLIAFLGENWDLQCPRQLEVATLKQTMRREIEELRRRLEHEVQTRDELAMTMRYDRTEV